MKYDPVQAPGPEKDAVVPHFSPFNIQNQRFTTPPAPTSRNDSDPKRVPLIFMSLCYVMCCAKTVNGGLR